MMVSFSAMSTFPLNSPYLSISLYNESNFCDFLVCATLSFSVSLVCLQEISPVKINRVKNVFFIYVFIFLIGYNGEYNRQLRVKLAIIFGLELALAIPSGFGRSRIRRNCSYTLL